MIDLKEHFELAWADEPQHRPVGDRIATGRRLLLMQRAACLGVAGTLGATAVALVLR